MMTGFKFQDDSSSLALSKNDRLSNLAQKLFDLPQQGENLFADALPMQCGQMESSEDEKRHLEPREEEVCVSFIVQADFYL